MQHVMMDKWKVARENDNCVHAIIDESVDITGLEFSLVNDLRQKIVTMKVTCHEIYLCSELNRPTYAQLGDSMKYVDGSGSEYYKHEKNENI
jgi:hypothetical protein